MNAAHLTHTQIMAAFAQAIEAAGMVAPVDLVPDGKVHRFNPDGRGKDRSGAGWYALHLDGVPAGIFGDWRAGLTQTWCSKATSEMTQGEQDEWRSTIRAMQAAREAETLQRQQDAAGQALQRWQAAAPAPAGHPYLVAKGVQAYGIRAEGNALLVPMRCTAGKLHSLQIILPDGSKRFMSGGRIKACYHGIGVVNKPDGPLLLCEGYATAATLHQATGHAVAACFSAGNLPPAGQALRAKFPRARMIVCADRDETGIKAAHTTARAIGASVAIPQSVKQMEAA